MPIVVVQSGVSAPNTQNTTTVGQILSCVSQDTRGALNPANLTVGTSDQAILIDYTNRISLDLLRHARWVFLLAGPQSFTTTATAQGVTPQNNKYWIGALGQAPTGVIDTTLNLTDFDIVKRDTVIDYSNYKRLAVSELQPVAQEYTIPAKPRIWQELSNDPNTLVLWPAPNAAYNIQFRYYRARVQLTNTSQIIQIPDRYKDIVCHGVTWLAFQYLKDPESAAAYQQLYQAGKVQIIKDMNLFPRAEEFVRPDPSAVTRQTTTGIGLDSGLETSIP